MRIEFDSKTNAMEIDGVVISLDVFKAFLDPDPRCLYRFSRQGLELIVEGRIFAAVEDADECIRGMPYRRMPSLPMH